MVAIEATRQWGGRDPVERSGQALRRAVAPAILSGNDMGRIRTEGGRSGARRLAAGMALLATFAAVAGTNAVQSAVTVIHDPAAVVAFEPSAGVVRRMVDRGLCAFAGLADTGLVWRSLVASNDVVGFKVVSAPGALSGTRPVVVRALVESLLAAGHPAANIVIWDKREVDLHPAGWFRLAAELGVRCAASETVGWDPEKAYESPVLGRLVAGDLEFDRTDKTKVGRKSHVTRLLTREVTKVVSVAPVLSHNVTAVNGHLFGLAWAGVDNTLRFVNEGALLAEAVPDICALDDLMPRVVLGVSDALICQYRGEDQPLLHYAVSLNELRFSKDLVALDALALADVTKAREGLKYEGEKPVKTDLYLNAELIELGVADLKQIRVTRVP